MKIGLLIPQISTAQSDALDFVQRCEALGVDGVFAFDHRFSPWQSSQPCLSLFPLLSGAASVTTRITIGSCIARVDNRSYESFLASLAAVRKLCNGGNGGNRFFTGLGFGDRVTLQEDQAAGLERLSWPDRLKLLEKACSDLRAHGHSVWLGSKSPEVGDIARRHSAGILLWNPPVEHLINRDSHPFVWAGLLPKNPAEMRERLKLVRQSGAAWAICGRQGGLSREGGIEAVLNASHD